MVYQQADTSRCARPRKQSPDGDWLGFEDRKSSEASLMLNGRKREGLQFVNGRAKRDFSVARDGDRDWRRACIEAPCN